MGPRPAQDPLGQDHAPHPAQDRRERLRSLGDTSTLADPAVVDDLVKNRRSVISAPLQQKLEAAKMGAADE
jgi:hypothetical protein